MTNIAMFKIEGGKAKALDAKGNFIKTVGESGARDARVQGDAITITYDTGKTKLYDIKGNYKKTL
jgi:hypothetical protein